MKRSRQFAAVIAAFCCGLPSWAFDASNIVPGTGTIEYAFTPEDDAAGLVERVIDTASSQVLMQAFSFTHQRIAAALVRAHRRGVDVQVVVDPEQAELIGQYAIGVLLSGKVPVYADALHSAAHNKIIVIDAREERPVLITGSFNFTFAAQFRNAENLLVFRGNSELVRAYVNNWEQHRAHSVPFNAGSKR